MKKQFQILATTFITIAIVSCSKERIEMQDTAPNSTEEITTTSSSSSGHLVVNPLLVNLEGWFPFDGNLKDQTKKLPDGISTKRSVIYTYDRKGIFKGAIKFDSTYGVRLFKVPQQTHASISLWVRYDNPNMGTGRMIVKPKTTGLGLSKVKTVISGSVDLLPNYSLGVSAGSTDKYWHHFVVTFDDDTLRIYKDGQLSASVPSSVTYPQILEDYFIGCKNNEWFEGSVDELRFYSRTLSANDVTLLYNQ